MTYASFSYHFATHIRYYGLLLQLCTFILYAVKHVLISCAIVISNIDSPHIILWAPKTE